jgi:hypothetical protein
VKISVVYDVNPIATGTSSFYLQGTNYIFFAGYLATWFEVNKLFFSI